LELTEARDSVAAKIRDRIAKGLELKQRAAKSPDEVEAFERDYRKWNTYNEGLLKALFTTDAAVTQYVWSVSSWIATGEPLPNVLTRRLDALESLVEQLEFIPLAPGVETAPAVINQSVDAVWRLIHPKVRQVAQQRFKDGHNADAVEAALKALNNEVKAIFRSRGGSDLDGPNLMHTAFSPNNPKIVLADLGSQSGKDMQQGYMELFAGAMSAVRNPKAHDNVTITPERALHFLFLASMLWTTLDNRV